MDIMLDFTENEIKALKILTGYSIEPSDDADARSALHDVLTQLAVYKGEEIPDLEED